MIIMDFPNAVTNSQAFYDRREEREKAVLTILAGKKIPIVIIGERRIGKTSLQNVSMEAVHEKNPGIVALQVEPRGNATVDQFVEAILRQLTKHLMRDIRDSGLYDAQGNCHINVPDEFDHAFQRLLPEGCADQFVLCIDEFDEIVRLVTKTGEVERRRLFDLVHHLIERSPLPLSLFFTITRVLDPMKEEMPSPIISKSQVIELRPFEDPVCLGMLDWLLKDQKVTLPPQVKERIVWLSGGHPYFIKLLVSNLTGITPTQDPLNIDLARFEDEVLPRALDDSRARYAIENIYKAHFNSNEKCVLLYLAERQEAVDASEFLTAGREINRAVRSLVDRHYLVEQGGKYNTRIHFLEYWFRNWVEFEEELERLNVHHMAGLGMSDPAMNGLD